MVKTSISRDKLYERNYTSDTSEDIEEVDKGNTSIDTSYNTVAKICTLIYMENNK